MEPKSEKLGHQKESRVRKACCICLSGEISEIEVIKEVPVYMGVTKLDKMNDIFHDQTWGICSSCSCVQLTSLLPQELLYANNHHQEVVGDIWKNHHREFAKFISQSNPSKVLEIGGAHGYLAQLIVDQYTSLEYTIVEPDSNLISGKIRLLTGYIEENLDQLKDKDTIVHSHVLEHIYEPIEFFFKVGKSMDLGAILIFSIPNMPELIRLGGMNALNFEHTYLLVVEQIESVAEIFGFETLEVTEYLSHSLFFRLRKNRQVDDYDQSQISSLIPNVLKYSMKFMDSISQTRKFVDETNNKLSSADGEIYIFGAHVFSQALFSLGLQHSKIHGVIDNAKSKQGSRLYGTDLKVFSPEAALANKENPIVIVRASHYQNEIIHQLERINVSVRIFQ